MYISVLQFYNCSGNLKYPRICSVRGGIDTKRSALPVQQKCCHNVLSLYYWLISQSIVCDQRLNPAIGSVQDKVYFQSRNNRTQQCDNTICQKDLQIIIYFGRLVSALFFVLKLTEVANHSNFGNFRNNTSINSN